MSPHEKYFSKIYLNLLCFTTYHNYITNLQYKKYRNFKEYSNFILVFSKYGSFFSFLKQLKHFKNIAQACGIFIVKL